MIPSWASLHPLIVHFPIALLLVAPVFMIMSMTRQTWMRRFAIPTVMLLLVGTIAAWGAKKSGKAAMMKADDSPAASVIMDEHEAIAKRVTGVFTGLTIAYIVVIGIFTTRSQPVPRFARLAAMTVLVGVNGYGAYDLARAAHLGGMLVHKYGIKAELIGEKVADNESNLPASTVAVQVSATDSAAKHN